MNPKKIAPYLLALCITIFMFGSAQALTVHSNGLLSDDTSTPAPTATPFATGYSSGGTAVPTPTGIYITGHSSGGIQPVSFWDMLISGFAQFIETYFIPIFPDHNSPSGIVQVVLNTIGLFFRLVWVFAKGNLNLGWFIVFLLYLIWTRVTLFLVYTILWLLRVFRQIKQTFWPFG